jgi:peptidoglycan/xylan/chitin deacetylase (PgdA/CDA1 family)
MSARVPGARHASITGSGSFGRRAFAAAVLGAALAGCAVIGGDEVRPPQEETLDVDTALGSSGTGSFEAEGLAASGRPEDPGLGAAAAEPPAQPAMTGRDQIAAKFAGRAPGQWGLQVAGIQSRLAAGASGPLLTFDCCGGTGGSGVDQALIDALTRTGTPAVFFLNSRWIQANPGPARALADNPLFELGNHGTRHIPLSVTGRTAYGIAGTASPAEVYDEVMGNQDRLFKLTGKTARLFRPGTAFYDEASVAIVRDLGLTPLGFSINGDGGATFPVATVLREVSSAKAGDIVIGHANRPAGGTAAGVSRALQDLRSRGIQPVPFPG